MATQLPTDEQIDTFERTSPLIVAAHKEFSETAKKTPSVPISSLKAGLTNQLLTKHQPVLSLVQDKSALPVLDEDEPPSYSDVVFLLAQYIASGAVFRERFHVYVRFEGKHRWITVEDPPPDYEDED